MRAPRLPSPLTLLVGCTVAAAALSYVLPAGQYDRHDDPATGRTVVVAGTFHSVPPHPVGAFQAIVTIPRGIIDAASVIAFVFLVGGAFGVVDRTGALRDGVDWLVRRLGDRGMLAIPIVSLAFAAGGAFENMQEEIIALVPVLLILTQRLGFDPVTAAAISVGAASVGASFSPINPFQVGIAQKIAQLPQLSGSAYRMVFLGLALALWIMGIMRHARKARRAPAEAPQSARGPDRSGRGAAIIAIVLITFVVFIWGVARLGWDFDQEAALFFLMGIVAGLVGGLGVAGTSDAFVEGFRSMAFAALLIGFARAITVALNEGLIIDTIVHGLSTPLTGLPLAVAALGMMAVQAVIHFVVPSVSGQAVLTLPILVPLSDLIGLSRQVTVLAHTYGAGLCELVTPTNGALMAILAAAGVPYGEWLRVIARPLLMIVALAVLALILAVAIKY